VFTASFNSTTDTRPRQALIWTALIAGLGLLVAWVSWQTQATELSAKKEALHRTVELYSLGFKGMVEKFDYLPLTVAEHPSVQQLLAKPESLPLRAKANQDLEQTNSLAGALALYVLDTQGNALAASNWQTPDSFVGFNYTNRPYFQVAMQGKRHFFYAIGQTSGVPGLFISVPVRVQGRIVGVVVVKVSTAELEAAWKHAKDPVVVLDERGIAFLSSIPTWRYRSTKHLSAQDLEWLNVHNQYSVGRAFPAMPWRTQVVAGQEEFEIQTRLEEDKLAHAYLAVNKPLSDYGWTLTVMSDLRDVYRARDRAGLLAVAAAALLLIGLLFWQQRVQKKLRERERLQEAQLQRSARLANLGEMASNLAHELNQPLMALSNYAVAARMMANQGQTDAVVESLNDIVSQAQRASEIVKRIRGFIKPQGHGRERCELKTLLDHVLVLLKPELQAKKTQVQIDLPAHLPSFQGDPVLLEQLFLNLLLNAHQAMLAKPLSRQVIELRAELEGPSSLKIEISDDGPGIAKEAMGQLFAPFFTTKPDGLGLGLNICRTIAEAHGGRLSFRNRDRVGATFTVILPLS
jgi:two-component system, NtrC family, C4-dicarboxylate transport sensor histidine kinase DctB